MMRTNRQSGAALITVLIVVFMVLAIITDITVKNYRVIKRLTNEKVMEQSDGILATAVDFGRAALATSAITSQIDTLNDIWAQPIPSTTLIDDMQLSGYITDEQSKFNINDLVSNGQVNPVVLNQFNLLLGYLNIPQGIGTNIAYYMAAPQFQSNIMTQYTEGVPAYLPAGKPLVDLSELLLVKGMQPEWVYKLSPYITAIPVTINGVYTQESNESGESTPNIVPSDVTPPPPNNPGTILVNVNTASAEVIAAKSGIPLPVAQRMVAMRSNVPFNSTQDVTNFLSSNGIMMSQNSANGENAINISTLTTQSSYFTIHAVINEGNYEFKYVALVYRANRSGLWPQLLWQHPE